LSRAYGVATRLRARAAGVGPVGPRVRRRDRAAGSGGLAGRSRDIPGALEGRTSISSRRTPPVSWSVRTPPL